MSSKQSTTLSRGRKAASDARFALVYGHQLKPKARHLDSRCWANPPKGYREATDEELRSLPICLHCLRRAERDAQAAKPERQPIPRNEPRSTQAAEKVETAA